jgi:hypothetical protein
MATIIEMFQNERALLGDPNPMSPNPRAQWRSMIAHIQSLYNQLTNSSEAWTMGETELTVSPQQDEYLVANIAGKPILVFTKDDTNPSHIERPISVVKIEDLLLSYEGPRDGSALWPGYWDGSNHTARAIAFFQKGDGGWWASIRPVPQLTATYRIFFVTGDWTQNASLGTIPVLPEHHHLLTVRAALSDLPNCEWGELSSKDTRPAIAAAWQRNYESRRQMLEAENAQYTRDFLYYIRSLAKPRITFRQSGYYY